MPRWQPSRHSLRSCRSAGPEPAVIQNYLVLAIVGYLLPVARDDRSARPDEPSADGPPADGLVVDAADSCPTTYSRDRSGCKVTASASRFPAHDPARDRGLVAAVVDALSARADARPRRKIRVSSIRLGICPEVAGHHVAAARSHGPRQRVGAHADVGGLRAAGMEPASVWEVNRARRIAADVGPRSRAG